MLRKFASLAMVYVRGIHQQLSSPLSGPLKRNLFCLIVMVFLEQSRCVVRTGKPGCNVHVSMMVFTFMWANLEMTFQRSFCSAFL